MLKLFIPEKESAALLSFLAGGVATCASSLLRVEIHRALRRSGTEAWNWARVSRALAMVTLIRLDDEILATAAELEPAELRPLDAIHLATALSVPRLTGLVSYDHRLSRAALQHGIAVHSPGAEVGQKE